MGGEVDFGLWFESTASPKEAGEPCWHFHTSAEWEVEQTERRADRENSRSPQPFPPKPPPNVSTTFPNGAIGYGPSFQKHESMGDIPCKIYDK